MSPIKAECSEGFGTFPAESTSSGVTGKVYLGIQVVGDYSPGTKGVSTKVSFVVNCLAGLFNPNVQGAHDALHDEFIVKEGGVAVDALGWESPANLLGAIGPTPGVQASDSGLVYFQIQ